MRWQGRRASTNVEDRRGRGAVPIVGGGIGLLIVIVISLLTGADPRLLLQQGGVGGSQVGVEEPSSGGLADEGSQFVSVALADTEDVWNELFGRMGRTYQEPKLVLFSGQVSSACGSASSAVGPFYCPGDRKVYIDLGFCKELQRRFLQADFLAGVWAHHAERTKHILERGDLEEALNAASAVGDDNIQRRSRGYVVPDSFTHGSSQQRVRWFRRGLESGDIRAGDTFSRSDSAL